MIDFKDELDDNHKKINLNKFVYSRSFIPLITLFISLSFFFFDNGPILPPFSSKTESIDCHSLVYENYSIHNGVIDFYVHQNETINFPPEYLPHFLSVYTINNENVSMEYSKMHLKNMSLINNTIKFTLGYPIASEIIIFLKCLGKDFAQQRVMLSEVNETDDETYSTKGMSAANYAKMTNVCFENTKFLFFTPVPGYSETIPFNQTKMRFEVLSLHLPSYLQMKNISRTNETSFLVPPFDPVPWKSLLFNLLPISLSLESNNETSTRKFHFLFREMPMKGSTEIIKRFSTIAPSKIKDIQCFKKILLPKSVSSFHPNEESIEIALSQNFTFLRTIFPKTGIQKRRIVLTNNLENILKPVISEICEDCDIAILNSNADVSKAADISHSAQIFVGNHFFNLINMVWLTPNRSALIDATPSNFSCARWAEVYSKFNNISYFRVNTVSDSCNCYDFDCYPKRIFGSDNEDLNVDIESFKRVFKEALNATKFEETEPKVVSKPPEIQDLQGRPDRPEHIGYPGKYRFI